MISGLALAAAAGAYSVGHPQRALVFGPLFVLGLILLDLNGRKGTLVDRFGWIPWAWVALLLVTDLRLINADPLAVAAGAANVQHLIQIAAYALVTVLVVRARSTIIGLFPRPVPKGLLLAFPLVAVASAAWSLIPIYTVVRALQLVVLALLALLVVRIWASDPDAGEEIFARMLRLFVQVVSILAVIGLATAENLGDRFTWLGMHPGVTATYTGAALLILILGGRSWLRFPGYTYWPRLLLFGVVIYLAQTRSVLAGIVIGIGVGLWFKGRDKPIARYLGVAYYLIGGLLFVLATSLQLTGYLTRGETAESIASLSGRIPLWEFAIGQLESVQEWALGFGYGSSRLVLLASPGFQWAGSAHSTWVEVLLGIGVVGFVATAATIVALVFTLSRSQAFGRPNVIALSILAFFLMASPISEGMALPGIGFGFLALLHVPALGKRALRLPRHRPDRARADVRTRG
ncbi:MAG TPA: O-antigen ligase family protein [Actinomycetota bacterium]